MADSKRRRKERLPKDVSHLTDDQLMEKVFSKPVVDEMKKAAHEYDGKKAANEP